MMRRIWEALPSFGLGMTIFSAVYGLIMAATGNIHLGTAGILYPAVLTLWALLAAEYRKRWNRVVPVIRQLQAEHRMCQRCSYISDSPILVLLHETTEHKGG